MFTFRYSGFKADDITIIRVVFNMKQLSKINRKKVSADLHLIRKESRSIEPYREFNVLVKANINKCVYECTYHTLVLRVL